MKDCPRCGSTLSHYAHGDGEAYGCDACGWVGVDVEHRSEPVHLESWTDAITRFESKFSSSDTDPVPGTLDRVDEPVRVPDDADDSDPEPTVERVPSDETVDGTDSTEAASVEDASETGSDDPVDTGDDAEVPESSDAGTDDEPRPDDADDSADTDPETADDDTVDDENQAEAA